MTFRDFPKEHTFSWRFKYLDYVENHCNMCFYFLTFEFAVQLAYETYTNKCPRKCNEFIVSPGSVMSL